MVSSGKWRTHTPTHTRRRDCAWKLLRRRVPIVRWLPDYTVEKFTADLIAGVTVGLTVMPQALAYATLAGLEPQYGLYSSFLGCFIYTIFGTCKDITIGPTALMALMTYQQISHRNTDFAILLCFLTGLVQLLMGILHLGVLIDFISIPVTVGFTSATSVIIATSQLKGLLGLNFQSEGFIETISNVINHIHESRTADMILGFSCIVILLLIRKLKEVKLKSGPPDRNKKIEKSLWLFSTSRNALVVLTCAITAFLLEKYGNGSPFLLTGHVRSGLPPPQLPPFHTTIGNTTYTFTEMCSELGSSIVLVPVIAVLGNVAIAKAFASGDSVDATQELLTLSMCNVFGSFFSSMPITGSFSRSAVNHASGVATPMGGVYTGIIVLLALSLLTPYFYFIPKAALAAVIICAVIFMIEYEVVKPMWKARRVDLVPAVATFILCLAVGVELGILAGVAVNVAFLLYPSARPNLDVERTQTASGVEYILITPNNSLYFPGAEYLRTCVTRAAARQGDSRLPVVVDCRYVLGADYTAACGVAGLGAALAARKQALLLLRPRARVAALFQATASRVRSVPDHAALDLLLNELSGQKPLTLLNGVHDLTAKDQSQRECLLKSEERPQELEEVISPVTHHPPASIENGNIRHVSEPLLENRNLPHIEISTNID